jgi:hypothetical protein
VYSSLWLKESANKIEKLLNKEQKLVSNGFRWANNLPRFAKLVSVKEKSEKIIS